MRRCELLGELDEAAFDAVVSRATKVELAAGATLGGDEADASPRVLWVVEGEGEVLGSSCHPRVLVGPGHSVGELALLEPQIAATRIRATSDMRLWACSVDALRARAVSEADVGPLEALRGPLQRRLVATVHDLRGQTLALRQRGRRMSLFIVYLAVVTGAFMFLREGLSAATSLDRGTTVVTLPLVLVMGVVLVGLMRSLGLPLEAYGITRRGWRASLRDGLWLSIPLVSVATLAKVVLVVGSPEHGALPILDPLDTRGAGPAAEGMVLRLVGLNLAYAAVIVPIQELIARGLLQGLLERVLESRYRVPGAIAISNLLFAAFHLYISLGVAVATLALGIILGWLYTRTRNLLGVWVAHAIVGMWSLTIVRLQPILG